MKLLLLCIILNEHQENYVIQITCCYYFQFTCCRYCYMYMFIIMREIKIIFMINYLLLVLSNYLLISFQSNYYHQGAITQVSSISPNINIFILSYFAVLVPWTTMMTTDDTKEF